MIEPEPYPATTHNLTLEFSSEKNKEQEHIENSRKENCLSNYRSLNDQIREFPPKVTQSLPNNVAESQGD
eukprot:Awhi_evm1s7408